MYQWQPSKWIKWAPLMAGLPFLAGGLINTGDLVNDVTARAQTAAGDWAKVEFDGRDAKLTGNATGQAALDAAVKAVADTYGVRTVDVSAVKIVQPVSLMAPTVDSLSTNNPTPEIKGTWPQDVAKTLAVTLNGKTYNLGKDAELTSDAGKWTLKPATAVADGEYDVTASVSDGDKAIVAATAPAKLIVDTVAPVAPSVVAPMADAKWPYAVTGTWPEAAGSGLAVKLLDKTYTLGKDDALKSDGKGNYSFAPTVDLKPGTYDLNFSVNDAAGNITPFAAPAAIVIPEAKAAEAAPAPAPLAAPTVAAVAPDTVWPYAVSGTWPEGEAKKLSIDLLGKNYDLGSKELISDGKGKFTFMPTVDLKPGKYDLDVVVTDSADKVTKTLVKEAIIVPEPAAPAPAPVVLAAPTVEKMLSESNSPVVKGTWDASVAKNLSVSLAGQTYSLGKDDALSDDKGIWTLKPSKPLANGVYDVVAEVGDGAGATTKDATVGELEVKVPPPPVVLAAPTVQKQVSTMASPTLIGTWDAKQAKSLMVTLGGQTYELGKNNALLSDAAGNWNLVPSAPLVNGTYDVVVETSDGAQASAKDASADELVIDVPPPPPPPPPPKKEEPAAAPMVAMVAPTVEPSTSDSDHPVVKGSWNAGVAKSLSVYLDGNAYKLGTNYELLSNAAGQWTLKPTKPLVNGTYEVIAVEGDEAGKTLRDKSHDELTVNVAPPPPAPPAAQPYDCEATLARISAVFPVRFEFNKDEVTGPYALSVNQYAALLKDPRCLSLKVAVEGHADFIGSEKYNQGLSERRAANVIAALTKGGIDAGRLSAKGYSKDRPLDPATNDTARAKNRRVEFTISK